MKYLTKILIICFLPITGITAENSSLKKLPQLDENTQKSLARNAIISIEPTGQINFDTQGGFRSTTLTRIGENGKIETYCTSSPEDARKFLAGIAISALEQQGEEE